MLKNVLRAAIESLGYSVRRISPPVKAPLPPRCVAVQPSKVELFPNWSIELDLSDGIQRHALLKGVNYEAPAPQILRTFCGPPGTRFFDLGANFGYYSYYMLAHCPRVLVHSFEPNPSHVRRHHAVAATLAPDRFFPHQLGLGDTKRELNLTVSSIDTGWSTFGANPDFMGLEESLTTLRVPVTTFDLWRAENNLALPSEPSWVVKMDVEGFEPKVLRGMREALHSRAFRALMVEVLDHTLNFCGTSAGELFAIMGEAGYAPFDLTLQPTVLQAQEARNVLFLPKV